MTDRAAEIGHQIAVQVANDLVRKAFDAGLGWNDIAIAAETVVAVTVCACATLSRTPDQARFVTEGIEMLTLRAHTRAMAAVTGVPQP